MHTPRFAEFPIDGESTGGLMARKIFTDQEIDAFLSDEKPITRSHVARLKNPKPSARAQTNLKASIDVIGKSGRRYRVVATRNSRMTKKFSVILMTELSADPPLNLIRLNGHHGPHPNPIEKDRIPSDTCHIHKATERYQRLKNKDAETFARATIAYVNFEGAVDYLSIRFGFVVTDDPYQGGLFKGQE